MMVNVHCQNNVLLKVVLNLSQLILLNFGKFLKEFPKNIKVKGIRPVTVNNHVTKREQFLEAMKNCIKNLFAFKNFIFLYKA